MDHPTRQKICQLVAGIVISDDILDAQEEAFVDRLIASFDVGGSGRDAIFPLVDRHEAAEQIRELPQQAQDEAMRLLIEAACIDGEIAPEEHEYLVAVGAALGLSETALASRVESQLAKGRG